MLAGRSGVGMAGCVEKLEECGHTLTTFYKLNVQGTKKK